MSSIPINANQPIESSLADLYILGKPIAASTTAVHAAITQPSSGTTVVTTAITNPDVPRVVEITGNQGTCTGNVVIAGTDASGGSITDTIAASGTSTVAGTKAFKTVTSITIPTRGASGDTIAIGVSAKLGIGALLGTYGVVTDAFLDGVYETTKPTFTTSATVLSLNTVTLSSASSMANTKIVAIWAKTGQSIFP